MPDPNSVDLAPEELRRYAHEVADWIADFLGDVESYPVLPALEPGELSESLEPSGPVAGNSMDEILADFREVIVPGCTQWNHPGFHAYFANTGSGPGILAEALTAALNVNGMVWRTGPAVTEVELRACDWLRQWLGLPDRFIGHIEDTASVSTLAALAGARHRATKGRVRDEGLGALPTLRVYCSKEAHSSVQRAVILLGMGLSNCRTIEVDDEFRMRPEALQGAIDEDRAAGVLPVAVVATVGTTSTTSVDPTAAVADICEREDIWLHVDAAYGGPLAIVPEFRWILEGVDRADSLVVNPHKWLFVPMDCSVLLCRHMNTLREALSLVPPYLMTPEDDVARNLMDYGPALGRRFRGLKLWFVLRWYGLERLQMLLRKHVELAATFASWVDEAPGWERVAPTPMSVVLFRHLPEGIDDEAELRQINEQILHRVNAQGSSFSSHTEVKRGGRTIYALRMAVGNARTELRHLESFWRALREASVLR
jgi:aromatic-L-amino-acid/L-tryptophan decarboxylase